MLASKTDASKAGVSLSEVRRVVISERSAGILFVLDCEQGQVLEHNIRCQDGSDVTMIKGR